MTMARTASLPWSAGSDTIKSDRAPPRIWGRVRGAWRRLWVTATSLPDRGAAATPDEVPREFYRYPCF
jgi:hypothetical protein